MVVINRKNPATTDDSQKQVSKVEAAPFVETLTSSTSLVLQKNDGQDSDSIKIRNPAAKVTRESYDDVTFELERRVHQNSLKRDIDEMRSTKKDSKRIKSRRLKKGKTDVVDGDDAYLGPWAKYRDSSSSSEDEYEASENEEVAEEVMDQTESKSEDEGSQKSEETEFFGKQEFDYQGRTYMHVPTDVGINLNNDSIPDECFVPKKCIHTWKGHINGTNKIELFPKSNHLLLSCGNDSNIYLWSVYHRRDLLRGYYGHSKPIKDINFNNDGTKFLSASYDHTIKLWDTETGKCLESFRIKSVANVVKFNPFNDNEFIIGQMNSKIDHYDIPSKKVIQSYDHHLGSINSITFLENKRFMSTSEDKTARVWDLQINIPVKIISDPTLHSMPVTRVHPSGKYIAAQSMDNTILVFSGKDRYKTNKKKLFTGHNCAGYGIGIDFSPDGKNLVSGDSSGQAIFWDWKTTKIVKKLKIDERAITQVLWNKKEVSKVVFTGTSGKIYYYE